MLEVAAAILLDGVLVVVLLQAETVVVAAEEIISLLLPRQMDHLTPEVEVAETGVVMWPALLELVDLVL
jgi:hypothetical protein